MEAKLTPRTAAKTLATSTGRPTPVASLPMPWTQKACAPPEAAAKVGKAAAQSVVLAYPAAATAMIEAMASAPSPIEPR